MIGRGLEVSGHVCVTLGVFAAGSQDPLATSNMLAHDSWDLRLGWCLGSETGGLPRAWPIEMQRNHAAVDLR